MRLFGCELEETFGAHGLGALDGETKGTVPDQGSQHSQGS